MPHQFIETVPHRGYRFLPEIRSSSAPSTPPRRPWRWVAAAGGVAALGALVLYAARIF